METNQWTQLWLDYRKVNKEYASYLKNIVIAGFSKENPVVQNAAKELECGLNRLLEPATVLVSFAQKESPEEGTVLIKKERLPEGSITGSYRMVQEGRCLVVTAEEETGMLYAVFHLLRMVATEQELNGIYIMQVPDQPLRMYNHWDNMDGSIERGYSGKSFFFEKDELIINRRTADYARFMASIGINGVVINNVNVKNAATYLITERYLDKVAELAKLFVGYGIKLFLSLNYAAPLELSDVQSADPFDKDVIAWWQKKMSEIFAKVPELGGFLIKADSEGRPGPFTYGRTQADGANMLADIVKPYGAIIIWRCFVYNCTQDWRDYKTDRARAAYDNFIEMDGDYHENVILQIKNGPMDFQIREPVSPLLGALKKTNRMLEVQIAQEYTGHQIDVCYLIPMFKEILDFKTYCRKKQDTVAELLTGRYEEKRNLATGIAAVCNTGNDANWTGNVLAAANLYGFGRLAFQNSLTAEKIAEEWVRMTLSNERQVVEAVLSILLPSREVYEKYTSPLGIGWMVTPHTHYGCSVDGYEYSRWGTYHRADHLGIGVDRTDTGTGYVRQYFEPVSSMYNDIKTCPEELLLFFHHVPYTHVLSTGKTLIQHIYDTHFEGVQEAEKMFGTWRTLEGKLPKAIFDNVKERFQRQLSNAKDWRDQVNSYFYRKSGIPDEKGRNIY